MEIQIYFVDTALFMPLLMKPQSSSPPLASSSPTSFPSSFSFSIPVAKGSCFPIHPRSAQESKPQREGAEACGHHPCAKDSCPSNPSRAAAPDLPSNTDSSKPHVSPRAFVNHCQQIIARMHPPIVKTSLVRSNRGEVFAYTRAVSSSNTRLLDSAEVPRELGSETLHVHNCTDCPLLCKL